MLREAERLLAAAEQAIAAPSRRPARRDRRRFECSSRPPRTTRWSSRSSPTTDDGLLALVTTQDAVVTAATERLATLIERTWPDVDARAARRLTEVVVRLGISHAALPSGSPAATARAHRRCLRPAHRRARSQGILASGLTIGSVAGLASGT